MYRSPNRLRTVHDSPDPLNQSTSQTGVGVMKTTQEVLEEWYRRVTVTQRAHYLSANHYGRRSYWLGVPVIALSTVVGTSVFATLQKQPAPWLQISVGLASVVAAVLASLQTFLGYSARAERHRVAGAKYGALGRELEELLGSIAEIPAGQITNLRERLDALALESPNNPLHVYRAARKPIGISRISQEK
jgi:hypothetical protein